MNPSASFLLSHRDSSPPRKKKEKKNVAYLPHIITRDYVRQHHIQLTVIPLKPEVIFVKAFGDTANIYMSEIRHPRRHIWPFRQRTLLPFVVQIAITHLGQNRLHQRKICTCTRVLMPCVHWAAANSKAPTPILMTRGKKSILVSIKTFRLATDHQPTHSVSLLIII